MGNPVNVIGPSRILGPTVWPLDQQEQPHLEAHMKSRPLGLDLQLLDQNLHFTKIPRD